MLVLFIILIILNLPVAVIWGDPKLNDPRKEIYKVK
jgi:hypothetical protein